MAVIAGPDGSPETAEAMAAQTGQQEAPADSAKDNGSDGGKPRRGWWQRTFGE
jgi:ribonuclease E